MRHQHVRFLWTGFVLWAMLSCQIFSPANGTAPAGTPAVVQPEPPTGSAVGPTPEVAQNPPDVSLDWFLQDTGNPQRVYYSITYTNRDGSRVQFFSEFTVVAYDEAGSKLGEQDTDWTGWIFPGQSIHTAEEMDLASGGKVARLEVNVKNPGLLVPPPGGKNNPLTSESASYAIIGGHPEVVGTISNSLGKAFVNVDVTALAFDANGKIIDAAMTNLGFISASGKTAVEVYLHVKDVPTRVELYPCLSKNVEFIDEQASPITVEKTGALLSDEGLIQAVFVVKNSTARTYDASYYNVSIYDSQGKAVAADDDVLPPIFPSSRQAFVTRIPFPAGASVARIEVQVQPVPDSDTHNEADWFVAPDSLEAGQAMYKPGSGKYGEVTATITNTSKKMIASFDAIAILYNATGQIVGCGEDLSNDPLSAGGQTQLEIHVEVVSDVDHAEIIISGVKP